MRNVVWCIDGMRFFGELAARTLGYGEPIVDGFAGECGDCHIVGLYDPPTYTHTLKNTAGAKRTIYHWCGTDVQVLTDASMLREGIHVCDSDGLKRELMAKGVDATTVMWPTKHHFEVTPLPAEKRVAVYLGSTPPKYGSEIVEMVASAMPDVAWSPYTFGSFNSEQMAELCASSRVQLRLTDHDGSAASPREFMEAGRRAVVTHESPYATQVRRDDLNGIIRALREALSHDEPDMEAAAYWKEQNSEARFLADLKGATC